MFRVFKNVSMDFCFCNFVVARISLQLPEQKEGLLFYICRSDLLTLVAQAHAPAVKISDILETILTYFDMWCHILSGNIYNMNNCVK